MIEILAQWLGWVLASSAAASAVLQFRHIRVRGTSAGVSLLTYSTWATTWLLWAAVSAGENLWAKAVSEFAGFAVDGAVAVVVAVTIYRTQRTLAPSLTAIVASAAIAAGALSLWLTIGLVAVVVFLTVAEIFAVAPQVRAAARGNCHGISVSAWSLSAVASVGWIAYAWVLADVWVAGWALVFAPASVFIAYRAYRKQRSWQVSVAAHPSQHHRTRGVHGTTCTTRSR